RGRTRGREQSLVVECAEHNAAAISHVATSARPVQLAAHGLFAPVRLRRLSTSLQNARHSFRSDSGLPGGILSSVWRFFAIMAATCESGWARSAAWRKASRAPSKLP